MAGYKKVDTSLNFVDREKKVIGFWNENDIFGKSVKKNEKRRKKRKSSLQIPGIPKHWRSGCSILI